LGSNYFSGERAERYDDFFKTPFGSSVFALERELLMKGLSRYFSGKCLEVGCGTGVWLKAIRDEGFPEPVGVDVSWDMLKVAKGKGLSNLVLARANFLPFKDDAFDLVFFVTSLEFMEDRKGALLEAVRVSRKAVAVAFLNRYSVLNFLRVVRSLFKPSVYRSENLLSLGELKKLAFYVSSVGKKGLKLERFLTTLNLAVEGFVKENLERKLGFNQPFGAFGLAVFRVLKWS